MIHCKNCPCTDEKTPDAGGLVSHLLLVTLWIKSILKKAIYPHFLIALGPLVQLWFFLFFFSASAFLNAIASFKNWWRISAYFVIFLAITVHCKVLIRSVIVLQKNLQWYCWQPPCASEFRPAKLLAIAFVQLRPVVWSTQLLSEHWLCLFWWLSPPRFFMGAVVVEAFRCAVKQKLIAARTPTRI